MAVLYSSESRRPDEVPRLFRWGVGHVQKLPAERVKASEPFADEFEANMRITDSRTGTVSLGGSEVATAERIRPL